MVMNETKRLSAISRAAALLMAAAMVFASLVLAPQETCADTAKASGSGKKAEIIKLNTKDPKKIGRFYFKTTEETVYRPVVYSRKKKSGYKKLADSSEIDAVIRYGSKLYYAKAAKDKDYLCVFDLRTGARKRVGTMDGRDFYFTRKSFVSGKYFFVTGCGYSSYQYPRTYVINAASGRIKRYDIYAAAASGNRYVFAFRSSKGYLYMYKWDGKMSMTAVKKLTGSFEIPNMITQAQFCGTKGYYWRVTADRNADGTYSDANHGKLLEYDTKTGKISTVSSFDSATSSIDSFDFDVMNGRVCYYILRTKGPDIENDALSMDICEYDPSAAETRTIKSLSRDKYDGFILRFMNNRLYYTYTSKDFLYVCKYDPYARTVSTIRKFSRKKYYKVEFKYFTGSGFIVKIRKTKGSRAKYYFVSYTDGKMRKYHN
ncbi:MAG: hypothetical protein ACI4LM_06450 [Anaerovoracaceae bacterium]